MYTRKYLSSINRGMILVDVLVAMSLTVFFVAIFSLEIEHLRQSLMRAHERMLSLVASSSTPTTYPVLPDYIPLSSTSVCSADFMKDSMIGVDDGRPINIYIKSIGLPIASNIPLTHMEVRDDLVFISGDSPVYADPDIFVLRVASSTATLVSSINTGPGISSFVLVGKRIFASAASTAAQLHTINLSSLPAIYLENKYKLPLPYATATPPYASSISFEAIPPDFDGRAYLGTEKWDGDEFNIIDVTNPLSPTWRNGLNVDSKVSDTHVRSSGGGLYISNAGIDQLIYTTASGVPAGTALGIIDKFSPSGWSRQGGRIASIYNDRLVFGRTSGGYDISTDHELFLWATTSLALSTPSVSVNIPGGVYGIVQDDSHVYVVTRQVGREFQIFDSSFSTSTAFSLPQQPQSLTCDGKTFYVLSHDSPTIYAISLTY